MYSFVLWWPLKDQIMEKLGENWVNQEPGGHRFNLGNQFKYLTIARRLFFNSSIYLLYRKCTVGLIIPDIADYFEYFVWVGTSSMRGPPLKSASHWLKGSSHPDSPPTSNRHFGAFWEWRPLYLIKNGQNIAKFHENLWLRNLENIFFHEAYES